ncbi:MAG: FecR domain-containing protein [Bacteroidota bacterium]
MDSRIKELFERYQAGNASSEERQLVEDWFASFDSRQQQEFNKEQHPDLFVQMDREIAGTIELNAGRNRVVYMRWLQVAAVLLAGVGAVILYKNFRKPKTAPVNYALIAAPKGVKKQFALPDGSIVYLNSGSSLRILPGFGVKNRVIALSGEAFFMVQHDPEKPFMIQSGSLLITDIGTSFDVKAYAEENQIEVSVETGEVNVKEAGPGKTIFPKSIIPNQQLIYNKDNRLAILNTTESSEISAWRKNQLRFDNASFGEIANTLERWYGVTVNLNGHTDSRRYTVSFNNEPVSNVLKVLEKLSGMNYQITSSSIQINLKPGKSMK